MGGNMFLIPADEPHHPIAMMPLAHCREAVLRFTASKHDAICCSSDRKSARAALGLARNTISQDSGNSDSYFRASTRKRLFTALRVTALPTALETAKPTRRPCTVAVSPVTTSSCIRYCTTMSSRDTLRRRLSTATKSRWLFSRSTALCH